MVFREQCRTKIKRRIALGKHAFQKKKNVLTNKNIIIEVRKAFAKTGVLFCMEVKAVLFQKKKNYLEAVEMWIWRRVTKNSWIKRKSNLKVSDEVKECRKFIKARMQIRKYCDMKRPAFDRKEWFYFIIWIININLTDLTV